MRHTHAHTPSSSTVSEVQQFDATPAVSTAHRLRLLAQQHVIATGKAAGKGCHTRTSIPAARAATTGNNHRRQRRRALTASQRPGCLGPRGTYLAFAAHASDTPVIPYPTCPSWLFATCLVGHSRAWQRHAPRSNCYYIIQCTGVCTYGSQSSEHSQPNQLHCSSRGQR